MGLAGVGRLRFGAEEMGVEKGLKGTEVDVENGFGFPLGNVVADELNSVLPRLVGGLLCGVFP